MTVDTNSGIMYINTHRRKNANCTNYLSEYIADVMLFTHCSYGEESYSVGNWGLPAPRR